MLQIVKIFWAAYRDSVLSGGVPKKFADGYVRWSEGFAKFIKGKPLKEPTNRDFEECPKPLSNHRSFL